MGKKHRHKRSNIFAAARTVGYLEGWEDLGEPARDACGRALDADTSAYPT
jgi:hypothetical protein